MATRNKIKDKQTFDKTIKEARIGHPESQYEVALMYANGVGVAQDFVKAIYWVQQAAERGFASAQYLLATRYSAGEVVEQDDHQALKWLVKAADQEHPKAIYKLAKFYSTTHTRAAGELCRAAARAGVPQAQYELATEMLSFDAEEASPEQAFSWCKKAAEQGIPAAQCALADRYLKGEGVARDVTAAYGWYRKAARQYHIAAQVALAQLDEQGQGRGSGGRSRFFAGAADRRRDAPRWVEAAECGNAEAKFGLGMMFEYGWGVPKDRSQALIWFQASAQQQHAPAQFAVARSCEEDGRDHEALLWYEQAANAGMSEAVCALSRLYWSGRATSMSRVTGVQWTMKAAEIGEVTAMMKLAKLFDANHDELALAYLEKAASYGLSEAQYQLGRLHQLDTESSSEAAFGYYQRAADQGHVLAQSALGSMYLNGQGVVSDPSHARLWLEKAAQQGEGSAQWKLALLLMSGAIGVERNLKQAFVWCQKAAKSGFTPAQATFGTLLARVKKFDESVIWWKLAAEKGDSEAQYNLAMALTKGRGTAQDLTLAFEWFVKAAEQGVVSAQSKVGLLYATGEGAAMDLIEAHKWFLIASGKGDPAAKANVKRSGTQLNAIQKAESHRRASVWSAHRQPTATTGKSI